MTVKEAKFKVIEFLVEKEDRDSISFDDLGKLIPTSLNRDEGITAILGALQELTAENVVYLNPLADISRPQSLRWALKEKLFLRNQSVEINGVLACQIASICQEFLSNVAEEDNSFIDPLHITEREISILVDLIQMLTSQESNNETKENDAPEKPKENKK